MDDRIPMMSRISIYTNSLILLFLLTFGAHAQHATVGFMRDICPKNYVYVPAMPPYTDQNFCVMKYEAKLSANIAISRPEGLPATSIPRGFGPATLNSAWKACRDNGEKYDLISNAQWQTIARNIASVGWNWSTGVAYSGELNRGHSDNAPTGGQAASPIDTNGCFNTGTTCTGWNAQLRTNRLSNGSIIWDFGGNVAEWVKDIFHEGYGSTSYVAQYLATDPQQAKYGASGACATPSTSPYCGYGHAYVDVFGVELARGGGAADNLAAGVFAAYTQGVPNTGYSNIGFRCVYQPVNNLDPCAQPNPSLGAQCIGGAHFAGLYNGAKYMVTPGGCTNSPNPTCSGNDSQTFTFGPSGNHSGANGTGDGAINTGYLISTGSFPAAQFCANLVFGGYDDWFLPVTPELTMLYNNRSSIPGFTTDSYWTSVHSANANAIQINFNTGSATAVAKTTALRVRCVRRY